MRRKVLSVLSALCMVVVMLLGAALPVQAADTKAEQTARVTIDGLSIGKKDWGGEKVPVILKGDRTINMYRLIKLNFSEDGNSLTDPTHVWTNEMAEWLKGAGSEKYGKYLEEVEIGDTTYNAVTEDFRKLQSDPENYPNVTPDEDGSIIPNSGKEITQFYQDVASAIKGNTLAISEADSITRENSYNQKEISELSIARVPMGAYIALYTFDKASSEYNDESAIYYPIGINVFPDSETLDLQSEFKYTIKHDVVSITKEVDDETVYNGQEVTYTLKTTIPYYPENANWDVIRFVIGDSWKPYMEISQESIQVLNQVGELIDSTNYEITYKAPVGEENGTFEISFTPKWLKANQGQTVQIQYPGRADVLAWVKLYPRPVQAYNNSFLNTASLQYSKNPYVENEYETIEVEKEINSYTLRIYKRDADNRTLDIQGAEFKVRKQGDENWLKFIRVESEEYSTLQYVLAADQESPEATDTIVMSGEVFNTDKYLPIRGLEPGKYEIQETKAPAGYIKPQGSFVVELLEYSLNVPSMDQDIELIDAGKYNLEVIPGETQAIYIYNKSVGSLDLPVTGGMGTLVFTVGGLAVMGGAVLLFIRNKKKTK